MVLGAKEPRVRSSVPLTRLVRPVRRVLPDAMVAHAARLLTLPLHLHLPYPYLYPCPFTCPYAYPYPYPYPYPDPYPGRARSTPSVRRIA